MGSYIEEVEYLFLSAVRKGMCLRASDLEIVRDWNSRNVPIEIVSRGIVNGIRKFLAEAEPSAPLPAALKYYRTSVEREFEIYSRATARGIRTIDPLPAAVQDSQAGTTAGTAPISLADRAAAILGARRDAAEGRMRDIYVRAIARFESGRAETPLADLLFQIEDMLVTEVGQSLAPDVFARLRDTVDGRMREAEARGVGRRALEDLRRNGLRRAVADEAGFSSFLDEVLKEHQKKA